MSPTDQSNDRLQRPILHLEFESHHYDLYTHLYLPYLMEPNERLLKNIESYSTSPNSGFNTRFAASPSPPWSTLSDTMAILFKNELKAIYFEQTAMELRRTEEYRYKWSGCCDPPFAKWKQGAPVLTDRDSIIDFFNKEVMLYTDVDVMRRPIEEFYFPLLGRYLYRTWLRQHDGRPPFQRGGFIVKPMLLREPLQTDLVQLSTFHTELSKFLSQSLDDLVAFDCYRQPGDTSPSLCPPTQSFRDHGYFMRPLFKALYVVYDDQFDDHDYLDEPMDRGEYEKIDDYRQRFIGWKKSNESVLLVRTGNDSHLSSPISFLPLFQYGLAFNVNRPDYQDEPEPTVVRGKLETALQFIADLLKKEEATPEIQRCIQEQDEG
ncbi:hypothetical protein ACHAPM_009721 [Fusarium culmorum]|uniref:Uncharacterized protein n=1 Tax=Fusarium culmorum TaxID=5516 RepID=A0A2T4GN04_FUSCU|nr:hypothetical protein FCULG_00000318 [Fusarium culmorum]